jgi:hypothetical protein
MENKLETSAYWEAKILNINLQHNMLIRTVDTLFDDIKSNLTKTVMFEEPVMVMESNDFDNQYYPTTIFGIEKSGLIGTCGDVTHLAFEEVDERDLTESIFDYITLQDKIYLLEHIIDNLK